MTERWLPVAGYEGLYEVSDLGRVRSLPRPTSRGTRGGAVLRHLNGGRYGFPVVDLSRDGKGKRHSVHLLVLRAFAGPPPPGAVSRHGPGGRADASLANLRWATREESRRSTRLTWEAVTDIRRRVAAGEKQRDVADLYGIHFAYLNLIVHRKRWACPPGE